MRLLLVEPDPERARNVHQLLTQERFNVYVTDTAEEAIDLGKLYDYDIILLALSLPDTSGFEVIRALRLANVATPILALSSFENPADEVRALALGADDYAARPLANDVLVARIHALVRRSRGVPDSTLRIGNLEVLLRTGEARVAGERVSLTGKEAAMLELLALRRGTTVTKEMMLNHMYGGRDEPEIKIIDVFVCKLRKKLQGSTAIIETVWGRGYILRERDEPRDLGYLTEMIEANAA